ncbi:carboxylesterase [Alphaproteobacteria bacterium GH1-50]|uniref:Carboxylesterase n=1 Tax=Kangsaoukella pontilimi TaxID=2691042 RepID=A0A7C9IGG2_9RHOB|nr:holin family protein [Kangsaoukella pontilimi]MXQ06862.1 carboxylesterase [Kangsaoukella pontilimi]
MGLIGTLMALLFGGGRNAVRETVEVFRPNAEASETRDAARAAAALGQFAAEFALPKRGWFDRAVDGLNRLPRPMLAFGTIGLFVAAMAEPVWFAERMQGIALIPEALWWLMGAIVSFYFGARHQTKNQDFQKDMAGSLALARKIEAAAAQSAGLMAAQQHVAPDANAAVQEWRARHER